ncbi:MAG: carboxypeptidase-like regulatory domain-containing protein [Microthrixaceae bacterium]
MGGIDATLVAGVNVSGNVTDESGNALQNVNVSIDAVNGGQSGWAQTDSNGNYTTTALPVGDYRVRFDDSNHDYAIEFWNNASTYDSANQLHIDGSGPVTGINAQLPLGARISGTVTGPNGAPAPNICVGAIYGSGDNPESTGWAQTNAAGQYEMRQLPAGPHRVRFEDCNDTGPFLDQWYDGTQNMEDAAVINLSTGSNQPGVDVELALAAQIRGKVTNTGGAPLGGICVQATTDTFVGGMGHSQGDGTYSIRLPLGGTYKVQFVDCGNPDGQPPTPGGAYLGKWWGGGLEPSTAQTVSVAAGGTVNDIDAVLSPSGGTGTISGRITNVRGEGLQACVVLFLPTQHVRFAPTDGNGNYSFTDVPTGTWNLGFLGCGQEDVSPVIPDAGNTGVFFNGVWYDGVQLQFTNDSPDPIAQGANLITVHPNESISANACMGCKSVTVKPPVIGDDYILVDFGDLGLTTTQPGAQSSAATLSYSVKCSSSTGKPTSATQTSYPVRVSGFTPGEPYVCSATVLSGDTEVGASASFAVTVGKRASSPTNSTGTTPAPGTRAFGPAAATPDAPDSASDSASGGAKPAQLAFTGSNLVSMVALATLMILLGAGITTATLRRHVRDKQAT